MKETIKLLTAVILTVVIEIVVLYLLKIRDKRLRYSIIINILTNLLLNSLLSFVGISWLYIVLLVIGEIIVFLIEWLLYNLIKKDEKNWLYSLSANLCSFLLGGGLIYLFFFIIF